MYVKECFCKYDAKLRGRKILINSMTEKFLLRKCHNQSQRTKRILEKIYAAYMPDT